MACSYYKQSPRNSLFQHTHSGKKAKVWDQTCLCPNPSSATFQVAWGQVLNSLSQFLQQEIGKNIIYFEDYHKDYR